MNEKQMRTRALDALYVEYQQARLADDPYKCNDLVRQMILHCNRLYISVLDFLLEKTGSVPAPDQVPLAEPPPREEVVNGGELPLANTKEWQCEHCGYRTKNLQQYLGHKSGHARASKKPEAEQLAK